MTESGLVFKVTSKIHPMHPSVEYQSIYFTSIKIHIMLFLYDVLSYFSTSKPYLAMFEGTDKIYLRTTEGRWNPGPDAYTKIEEIIMDW